MKTLAILLAVSAQAFAQLPREAVKCSFTLEDAPVALVVQDDLTAFLEAGGKRCEVAVKETQRTGRNKENIYLGLERTSCESILKDKFGIVRKGSFKLSGGGGFSGHLNLFYGQASLSCASVDFALGYPEKLVRHEE